MSNRILPYLLLLLVLLLIIAIEHHRITLLEELVYAQSETIIEFTRVSTSQVRFNEQQLLVNQAVLNNIQQLSPPNRYSSAPIIVSLRNSGGPKVGKR